MLLLYTSCLQIASFMNLPWIDTPEGLLFRTEFVIGINNRALTFLNPVSGRQCLECT
jgi:hypothetical protein